MIKSKMGFLWEKSSKNKSMRQIVWTNFLLEFPISIPCDPIELCIHTVAAFDAASDLALQIIIIFLIFN